MNEILSQEIEFFEKIKGECEIVFDIGCRDDIDYLKACNGKTFYMFEPNPIYYIDCKIKIEKEIINNMIYLYNFGISNKTGIFPYWSEYQSFFKRHYLVPSFESQPCNLLLKRFSEYLEENNIEKIDFLKIDTEGGDPDILLDSPDFLKNNVKFVQFEYGSAWIDRDDDIRLDSISSIYKDDFYFYILYNKGHPISDSIPYSFLVKIDNRKISDTIELWMMDGSGFEVIMINKNIRTNALDFYGVTI
jgi:FkbM family methyltransferase